MLKITFIIKHGMAVLLCLCIFQCIGYAGPIVKIEHVDITSFPIVSISGKLHAIQRRNSITKDNFTVLENGKVIKELSLKHGQLDNVYIALCIDTSKSLSKNNFLRLKNSAISIIKKSPDYYKFLLYKFNNEVVQLASHDDDSMVHVAKIKNLQQLGKCTQLFNCLYTAIDDLSKFDGVKAILLFTDGKDEGSDMLPDDVISIAREHSTPVYTVLPQGCRKTAVVSRLSKAANGKLFIISDDINKKILQLMQSRMSSGTIPFELSYHSSSADGIGSVEVRFNNGTVSDNDIKYVNFKIPSFTAYRFNNVPFVVLAGIIVLLIVALVVVFIIFMNKWKHIVELVSMQRIPRPVQHYYDVLFEKDEAGRKEESNLLLSSSPEYSYTSAWLVEKSGPETGKKFPLIWDEVTIGHGKENTIVINDDAVSLKHAKIKKINDCYYLFDCASDNGTFLNNKKLLRPKMLTDWDEIQIGRTTILFRGTKIKH